MDAHLIGDNSGQGSLPQSRRSVEENVIQCLTPLLCRFYVDFQISLRLLLPDILVQFLGPQTVLVRISSSIASVVMIRLSICLSLLS